MSTRIRIHINIKRLLILIISTAFYIVILCGCTPAPHIKQHALALNLGLKQRHISTPPFTLTSYYAAESPSKYLNIYLEGDGIPWLQGIRPNANPTGQIFLGLELMQLDPGPKAYLNRPCYGVEIKDDSVCHPQLWTSGRYSETIVSQMNRALDLLVAEFETKHINLIGHSGGGTIAILLASKRKDVKNLITINANFDHASWTEEKGYEPLTESLNAIDYLPLQAHIKRWHLIGGQDKVIGQHDLHEGAKKDKGAKIIIRKNFNHSCCWRENWLQTLKEIKLNESDYSQISSN